MRELCQHQRESAPSPFIFVSERSSQLSPPGFFSIVERAGVVADLSIKVHAHMLRHSTGNGAQLFVFSGWRDQHQDAVLSLICGAFSRAMFNKVIL
jgi:hypothetical protein